LADNFEIVRCISTSLMCTLMNIVDILGLCEACHAYYLIRLGSS
jgi:hypothetical protein